MPEILLDRAINQARAGANYTRVLLPEQVAEEPTAPSWPRPAPRPPTRSRPTPTSWRRWRPQAHGDWAFGEERYNAVLRDAEMLGFDARALRERGRAADRGADRLLRAGAKEISGYEDWHALLLELNKDRPDDAGGDAARLRGLDRARARLPA